MKYLLALLLLGQVAFAEEPPPFDYNTLFCTLRLSGAPYTTFFENIAFRRPDPNWIDSNGPAKLLLLEDGRVIEGEKAIYDFAESADPATVSGGLEVFASILDQGSHSGSYIGLQQMRLSVYDGEYRQFVDRDENGKALPSARADMSTHPWGVTSWLWAMGYVLTCTRKALN